MNPQEPLQLEKLIQAVQPLKSSQDRDTAEFYKWISTSLERRYLLITGTRYQIKKVPSGESYGIPT